MAEDRLKLVYNAIRGDKNLGADYKGVSYDQFKEVITSNPDARKDVFSDLKAQNLVSGDNADDYWAAVGIGSGQPPKVSLAPPTPTNPSSQTASQIAGTPVQVEKRPIAPNVPEPTLRQQMGEMFGIETEPAAKEEPIVEMPQFKQWQSEKELQQEAKSPVFRDYASAQNVLKDREAQEARNPYGYVKELLSGKVIVFSKDDTEPEREFASMNEAQSVLAQQGLKAAPNGLIMPTKEAEEAFNQKTPEEQQQIIQGTTGFERGQEKAREKKSIGQVTEDLGATVWAGGKRMAKNLVAGMEYMGGAALRMGAAISKNPNTMVRAAYEETKARKDMYQNSVNAEKEFQNVLAERGIQTSALSAIEKGQLNRLPESVLYTIGDAAMQIVPAILTYGGSAYFQTLPDAYKDGVDAIAKKTGRTAEQVIESGDDAMVVAQLSAGLQAALEKAGAGMVSNAIASKGGYAAIRDILMKKGLGKNISRIGGAAFESVGEGTTEYAQELAGQLATDAATSGSVKEFLSKFPETFFDPEKMRQRNEAFVGGMVGGGGLIGAGKTAKAVIGTMRNPKVASTIEDVPVASQESAVVTEDGKVVYDEKNVEVTPEEFQAYQEGVIDPERQAGLADDVAKGVTPESVAESDPLYARMLENEYAKRQTNDSQEGQGQSLEGTGEAQVSPSGSLSVDETEVAPGFDEEVPLDLDAELAALEGLQMEDEEAAPGFDEGIFPIEMSLPAIEVTYGPSSFDVALKKLGYTDDEISGMTIAQKQDILIKKTEPARAESSAKVDSVKENEKQEKIAKAFAALEKEPVPLPDDESAVEADSAIPTTPEDIGNEAAPAGVDTQPVEPGGPEDQGEVVSPLQQKINEIESRRRQELKQYPIEALLVKENVVDGFNKLLEGEDADYQNQRIERTIASGVKNGLTREQIVGQLNANGHVFNLGNDTIAINNFIQNRIDGKENRTFEEFKRNPNAEINARYDAEIAALEQQSAENEEVVSEDPQEQPIVTQPAVPLTTGASQSKNLPDKNEDPQIEWENVGRKYLLSNQEQFEDWIKNQGLLGNFNKIVQVANKAGIKYPQTQAEFDKTVGKRMDEFHDMLMPQFIEYFSSAQPIVKQPAVPLTTGEGKEGQSPIQSFDAAQSLKGEEGRAARKALKESMGKEQYKDLETITNKFPQIAKDLESRGVWKIDCP